MNYIYNVVCLFPLQCSFRQNTVNKMDSWCFNCILYDWNYVTDNNIKQHTKYVKHYYYFKTILKRFLIYLRFGSIYKYITICYRTWNKYKSLKFDCALWYNNIPSQNTDRLILLLCRTYFFFYKMVTKTLKSLIL